MCILNGYLYKNNGLIIYCYFKYYITSSPVAIYSNNLPVIVYCALGLRRDKHQVISVSLTLRSHSLNETISYILRKCRLEEKLDTQLRKKVNEKETEHLSPPTLIIDDWDNIFTTRGQKRSSHIPDTAEWIKNVVQYARQKQINAEPIIKENIHIKSHLCHSYNLADIHMHNSWSALTKHGYLISLKKLLETNNNLWSKVSSTIDTPLNIRVGYISTVTYNSHVCLHSEDTHQLWIQVSVVIVSFPDSIMSGSLGMRLEQSDIL